MSAVDCNSNMVATSGLLAWSYVCTGALASIAQAQHEKEEQWLRSLLSNLGEDEGAGNVSIIFRHVPDDKRPFCQDRLGTNAKPIAQIGTKPDKMLLALFAGYRAATVDVAQSLGLREEELEDELGAQELRSMIEVRPLHLLCVCHKSVNIDPFS